MEGRNKKLKFKRTAYWKWNWGPEGRPRPFGTSLSDWEIAWFKCYTLIPFSLLTLKRMTVTDSTNPKLQTLWRSHKLKANCLHLAWATTQNNWRGITYHVQGNSKARLIQNIKTSQQKIHISTVGHQTSQQKGTLEPNSSKTNTQIKDKERQEDNNRLLYGYEYRLVVHGCSNLWKKYSRTDVHSSNPAWYGISA